MFGHFIQMVFHYIQILLPSHMPCTSPSLHSNTSPKWLTLNFFKLHSWSHPGKAKMLCMLTKKIHKYTTSVFTTPGLYLKCTFPIVKLQLSLQGFQLLLGSHKVFLRPELKLVSQFILLMSWITLLKIGATFSRKDREKGSNKDSKMSNDMKICRANLQFSRNSLFASLLASCDRPSFLEAFSRAFGLLATFWGQWQPEGLLDNS